MISVELAERLKRAGLRWTPTSGDRFVIPDRDLDDQVFVISEMVVESRELPSGRGRLLAFNGTTEWALDAIMEGEVIWLPHEHQLRALLGDTFVSLTGVPGGYVVAVAVNGHEERHVDIDAESAYARAVLGRLEAS